MNYMIFNEDRSSRTTQDAAVWLHQLYAACEMLRASDNGIVTALSLTLPRTNSPDILPQVELLSTGLAELHCLDVAVDAQDRSIIVRFALRNHGGDGGA